MEPSTQQTNQQADTPNKLSFGILMFALGGAVGWGLHSTQVPPREPLLASKPPVATAVLPPTTSASKPLEKPTASVTPAPSSTTQVAPSAVEAGMPPLISPLPAANGSSGTIGPFLPQTGTVGIVSEPILTQEARARVVVAQFGAVVEEVKDGEPDDLLVSRQLKVLVDPEQSAALKKAIRAKLGSATEIVEAGEKRPAVIPDGELDRAQKNLEVLQKKFDQAKHDFLEDSPVVRGLGAQLADQVKLVEKLRRMQPHRDILMILVKGTKTK